MKRRLRFSVRVASALSGVAGWVMRGFMLGLSAYVKDPGHDN